MLLTVLLKDLWLFRKRVLLVYGQNSFICNSGTANIQESYCDPNIFY